MIKFIISMITLLLLSAFTGCGTTSDIKSNNVKMNGINALVLVPKNYGLNYQLMREAIDQYGWNLTFTGVSDTITACPPVLESLPIDPIIPDLKTSEINSIDEYDCLIIIPATGSYYEIPDSHEDIIQSPETIKLIRDFASSGKPIFSSCAGVRVLAAADVIKDKVITGSPRFAEEYKKTEAVYIGKDKPPTISDNIVTSIRGQANSITNLLAISSLIESNKYDTGTKKKSTEQLIFSDTANFGINDVVFAKTYGGFASDGGFDMIELDNGGFLITGYTYSEGSGDADLLVIKTKEDGTMEWYNTYGGRGNEYGYAITGINNDEYLITGYTTSFGAGDKDVYLIKINSDGELIWEKSFGGKSWDVGKSVCLADDDEYLVCGFTHSFGEGEEDIYVVKVDKNGNEIWSKSYGGERFELGNTILASEDDTYLIGGTSLTYAGGNTDMYLLKIDGNGNKIWDIPYQCNSEVGYGFDWCRTVIPSANNGYILAGITDCNQLMDAFVKSVDFDGNNLWQMSTGPGFYFFVNAAAEINNGQVYLGGAIRNLDNSSDIYFASVNPDGTVNKQKRLAAGNDEYCWDICYTKDGGIALLGYTNSFGKGKFDVFLIKVKDIDSIFSTS